VDDNFTNLSHQVIMPTKNGNFGTNRLNPAIQMRLNPHGETLDLPRPMHKLNDKDDDEKSAAKDLMVREGDKFLWTRNRYKLGMFNGEIGNINWVNDEDGSLGISTPDKDLTVPAHVSEYSPVHGHVIQYDPRRDIELGYAVTTHKSQGSEFDTIIYCCTSRAGYLLGRRNFYTAITRARNRVVLVMDSRAMSLCMRKVSKGERDNGT
jgi:exodeoxyribonuclease V alpha subunit